MLLCTESTPDELVATARAFTQLRFNPGREWLLAFLGRLEDAQVRGREHVAVGLADILGVVTI